MSKKHYVALAKILDSRIINNPAEGFDAGYVAATEDIAIALADLFASDNPHFDRTKFLTAAGVAE